MLRIYLLGNFLQPLNMNKFIRIKYIKLLEFFSNIESLFGLNLFFNGESVADLFFFFFSALVFGLIFSIHKFLI